MSGASHIDRTFEQLSVELADLKGNRFQPPGRDHRPRFLSLLNDVASLSQRDGGGAITLAIDILRMPGHRTTNLFNNIIKTVDKIIPASGVDDRKKEELVKAMIDDKRFSLHDHGKIFSAVLDDILVPLSPYPVGIFLVLKANSKAKSSLRDVHILSDASSAVVHSCRGYITRALEGYRSRGVSHDLKCFSKNLEEWSKKAPLLSAALGSHIIVESSLPEQSVRTPTLGRVDKSLEPYLYSGQA